MIERDFIAQKTKEFYIKRHIEKKLSGAGVSQITLKKIPLGEKIIIKTSRPSVIVGSKGSNIRALTTELKQEFKLENPQIEIVEVKDIFLDANVVAQRIVFSLERFGSSRFKGVGHKVMRNVLDAGALGVEIIISGKIPGARAKNWRFYQGYLKKCGDVARSGVRSAQAFALLKSGVIGIKVAIMPPNIILPDSVEILDEPIQIVEEIEAEGLAKKSKKKPTKRKTTKKKVVKTQKEETLGDKSSPNAVKEEVKEEILIKTVEEPKQEETPIKEAEVTEQKTEENQVTPAPKEPIPGENKGQLSKEQSQQ